MLRCSITAFLLAANLYVSQFTHAKNRNEFLYNDSPKWSEFGVGSWKLVRVYRETLNEEGAVESFSIDETKTTLVEVTEEGYTIRADVVIEVAGRRFQAAPKYFEKSWNGQSADQSIEVQDGGNEKSRLRAVVTPLSSATFSSRAKTPKRHCIVYYSADVAPYVLRMETVGTDAKGEKTDFNTVVEVIAVDMPHKVLSEIKTTSHVQTSEQRHRTDQEKLTVEVQCTKVPGWVVAHSSKLVDKKADRVVERTTLELLDYEALPVAEQSSRPLMSRRRGRARYRNRGRR